MNVGRGLVLAVLLLTAAGCRTTGLDFVVDDRLAVTAPTDRELVRAPVTVEWEAEDFALVGLDGSATREAGAYQLLIDRDPQPPGESAAWFARGDETCRPDAGCPDAEYLLLRGVVVLETTTAYTLPIFPQPARTDRREFHEVTVILLDGQGNRIGEGAVTRQFELDRTRPTPAPLPSAAGTPAFG